MSASLNYLLDLLVDLGIKTAGDKYMDDSIGLDYFDKYLNKWRYRTKKL